MPADSKRTAVITGASAGIGAIYADRLARRGYDLILVARGRDGLEAAAERIKHETRSTVTTIAADLTNSTDLARVEEVLRSDESITVLVNNAGMSINRDLAEVDPEGIESMIKLNVLAPSRLARAAVSAFLAHGRGTLINISSTVAIAPEALNSVYSGSKAYLLAFSQRLRREIKDKGIRLQVVLPGPTRTAMWEKAGTDIATLPAERVIDAEKMVDAALAGLDLGEFVTIPSLADAVEWERYDAARQNLIPKLSGESPAPRYASPVAIAVR